MEPWRYDLHGGTKSKVKRRERNVKNNCLTGFLRGLFLDSKAKTRRIALSGCSYGRELARLAGLAHLGVISPSLRNSYKNK